ncbi:hypothetical protein BDA96_09G107400 [Sorghum bicolor]|uniref:Uncharacterized protein n=2 Tax=Sorghum bicolor TaxID=4558 RepID=A0A921U4N6_SORBI|nr:hypothetical protein BDA96_09G107400 [Sorghum bicolor]OQU77790.1 hypothetical protein SORBI_3009G103201 [Sorghum bicolor]
MWVLKPHASVLFFGSSPFLPCPLLPCSSPSRVPHHFQTPRQNPSPSPPPFPTNATATGTAAATASPPHDLAGKTSGRGYGRNSSPRTLPPRPYIAGFHASARIEEAPPP